MPGKRPRPIRRTTSVSQLSSRLPPSPLSVASPPPPSTTPSQHPPHTTLQSPLPLPFTPDASATCASAMQESRPDASEICPFNAPCDESMGANADDSSAAGSEMMQNGSSMMWVDDADALVVALDSVNESQRASPSDGLSSGFRSADSPSFTPSGSAVIHTRSEPSDSMRPVGFLEICFHCKRRLRAGRDIFMYRGDRAFCSIECRHHQMAADERKEKCAVSAAKKGSASAVTTNTGDQVGPAETAAAA